MAKAALHCIQNAKKQYLQNPPEPGTRPVNSFGSVKNALAVSKRKAAETVTQLYGNDGHGELSVVPAPQSVIDREEKAAARLAAAKEKLKVTKQKAKDKAAKEKAKQKGKGKPATKKTEAVTA